MLRRWNAFTRFFEDGRVCLTNKAAERALRGMPLGRKALPPIVNSALRLGLIDPSEPWLPQVYEPKIQFNDHAKTYTASNMLGALDLMSSDAAGRP